PDGLARRGGGAPAGAGTPPAVGRVQLPLARHARRAHAPAVLHDRGRRFVTRGLDAEDAHDYQRRACSTTVSPSTRRSIPARRSAYSERWASCAHITSAYSMVSAQ